MENGEECDIFPVVNSCCSADCKLLPKGEICRSARGVCDVADTCSGDNAICVGIPLSPFSHCSFSFLFLFLLINIDNIQSPVFLCNGTTTDKCTASMVCTFPPPHPFFQSIFLLLIDHLGLRREKFYMSSSTSSPHRHLRSLRW